MEILCQFPTLPSTVMYVSGLLFLCQIFYVAWLAVETIFVYFFIIETKNKTLEETSVSVLNLDILKYRLNISSTGFSMEKIRSVKTDELISISDTSLGQYILDGTIIPEG